jgi:hypothetical protein
MQTRHKLTTAALALALSVALAAPAALAATALTEEEMDHATAAGQGSVHKGNGAQTILDFSTYLLILTDDAQKEPNALSIANVVGENNAAVAQNIAVSGSGPFGGGNINQSNEINQDNSALVVQQNSFIEGGTLTAFELTVGTVASGLEFVEADNVKIGNGEQFILDDSLYLIVLDNSAQKEPNALSILNVAGRNNAAIAQNIGVSNGGAFGVGNITQSNVIVQNQ